MQGGILPLKFGPNSVHKTALHFFHGHETNLVQILGTAAHPDQLPDSQETSNYGSLATTCSLTNLQKIQECQPQH